MNIKTIEVKAKCEDLEKIRHILKSNKAKYEGQDFQTDTYFKVNHGKLKLREGNIENNLIYYEREDKKDPKQSNVILFNTNPESSLKLLLLKAFEVIVSIKKKREIYFIGNVKFHLDEVGNLGSFVEIEALDLDGSIEPKELRGQCKYYMDLFGISKDDLLPVSYCDLLLERQ